MILTGPEITKCVLNGKIVISPFLESNVNPNSYNFRLHPEMVIYEDVVIDVRKKPKTRTIRIGENGYLLQPRQLYLATTIEHMGSRYFAPTYAARSSIARLGMFINLSASLGDIGFIGQWTIQLFTLKPIRVYAGMNIGQMMFWKPQGNISLYDGKYQGAKGALASKIYKDFESDKESQDAVTDKTVSLNTAP